MSFDLDLTDTGATGFDLSLSVAAASLPTFPRRLAFFGAPSEQLPQRKPIAWLWQVVPAFAPDDPPLGVWQVLDEQRIPEVMPQRLRQPQLLIGPTGVTSLFAVNIEALAGIAATRGAQIESLGSGAAGRTLNLEALAGIAALKGIQLESIASKSATLKINIEAEGIEPPPDPLEGPVACVFDQTGDISSVTAIRAAALNALPPTQKLTGFAGDFWSYQAVFTTRAGSLEGCTIRMTLKASRADADDEAVVQISTSDGITIDDETHATFELTEAQTELLNTGRGSKRYFFDVAVVSSSGRSFTACRGEFIWLPQVTQTRS